MTAVNRLSRVDPQGAAVQAAKALGMCFGDCAGQLSPFAQYKPEAQARENPEKTLACTSG
jgi:hypothetical protein